MLKKISALALSALLLLLLAAACKPESTAAPTPTPTQTQEAVLVKPGETYTIHIYNIAGPEDVYAAGSWRTEERKKVEERMEAEYGISIEFLGGEYSFNDMTSAAFAGAPQADIMHAGGPFLMFGFYAYQGIPGSILEPLSRYPDAGDFNDGEYWDTVVHTQSATFDDELFFAVPRAIGLDVGSNQVCYFNYRLVNNLGSYEPETLYQWSQSGQWTWERFQEVLINCTDKDNGIVGLLRGENDSSAFALITANNGALISKREVNGRKVDRFTGMEENAVMAWEYFVNLNKLGVLSEATPVDADRREFPTGKYAFAITYVYRTEHFYKMEDDYGILMVPKGPSAEQYYSDANWFEGPYVAFRGTKNPGGTVQVLHDYFKPVLAKSSLENQALFEQEASTYIRDTQSLDTLKALGEATVYSSFMMYVGNNPAADKMLGKNGGADEMLSGATTPSAYFSALESAINTYIDEVTPAQPEN